MGHPYRVQKRKMSERLEARQTTSSTTSTASSSASFPVPTAKIALTSTYTGASTCAQNMLTMLPPPSYQIWANEPVPVANNTVANCYPTEFLESYTSVMVTVGTSAVPSSIVPVMSPFACPKDYCTALASARNYIVCCPTGYQFHPPDSTVDSARPFYGGTCYSDMTSGSSYPVVQYNTNADTASTLFPVTASGVQAFAHPIDGFAMTSPTALGCSVSNSDSSLSTDSSSPAGSSSSSSAAAASTGSATASENRVSGGAIAGAVIGSILGLAAIVGLVFFLLAHRRRKQNNTLTDASPREPQPGDSYIEAKGDVFYRHEAANSSFPGPVEIAPSPQRGFADEKIGGGNSWAHNQMNDGHGAIEMSADTAIEMYAGPTDKYRNNGKNRNFPEMDAKENNRSSIAKVLDKHDKERLSRSANWGNY